MKSVVFLLLVVASVAFGFVPAALVRSSPSCLNMVSVDTSNIKNGMTIEFNGEPYKILNFSVMKQARGAAKTTIKFKNLMKGNTIENTYRSGEKFETAMIVKQPAQYIYTDESGNYCFMDSETFEEVFVEGWMMEGKEKWITEGMEVTLVNFKDRPFEVVIPSNYVYEIVETEPSAKGNTAQGHTKPATLSSGAIISVPGYLSEGEAIKVDTEKGVFLERAN